MSTASPVQSTTQWQSGNVKKEEITCLKNLLHSTCNLVMLLADNVWVEDSRRGVEWVDGGVDAQLGNASWQHSRGIEVSKRRGRGRVCQVVSWHVDCLHTNSSLCQQHAPQHQCSVLSLFLQPFPGELGLEGFITLFLAPPYYSQRSVFVYVWELLIEAEDDGSGGDNWSYKTCKFPLKLSPPTNQHPMFYRPDGLPEGKT